MQGIVLQIEFLTFFGAKKEVKKHPPLTNFPLYSCVPSVASGKAERGSLTAQMGKPSSQTSLR